MSTQAILQKEETSNPLRIAIVGARSSKWTKEQEKTMKMVIEHILENLKVGQLTTYDNDGKPLTSCKNIHYKELGYIPKIIIVLGHCPVGEEELYDVNCDVWLPREPPLGLGYEPHEDCKAIKVFTQGGVDTWTEIISAKLGIKTEIHPAVCTNKTFIRNGHDEVRHDFDVPSGHYWTYHYKPRNIDMAKSDIVIDIEPAGKCRHCGGTGKDKRIGTRGKVPNCRYCKGDGAYSGGTFTLKEARKRKKEVHKVIIK